MHKIIKTILDNPNKKEQNHKKHIDIFKKTG